MRIGVITDRLSDDFEEAVRLAAHWGCEGVEIRGLYGKRVPHVTDEEAERVSGVLARYGLSLWALSPGAFCCSLYDKEFSDQAALFEETVGLAARWGAEAIVISGVRRHWKDRRGDYRRIIEALSRCIAIAAQSGISVHIENNFGWFNDNPENILRMQKVLCEMGPKICWNITGYFAAGAEDWSGFQSSLGDDLGLVHISDLMITAVRRPHFPAGAIVTALAARQDNPRILLDGIGSADPDRAHESLAWIARAVGRTLPA